MRFGRTLSPCLSEGGRVVALVPGAIVRRSGVASTGAGQSDRRLTSDRGAVHDAGVAVVAAGGVVLATAVVPHGQHVGRPDVAIDEVLAGGMLEEKAEQRLALRDAHALDAHGVDRVDE